MILNHHVKIMQQQLAEHSLLAFLRKILLNDGGQLCNHEITFSPSFSFGESLMPFLVASCISLGITFCERKFRHVVFFNQFRI